MFSLIKLKTLKQELCIYNVTYAIYLVHQFSHLLFRCVENNIAPHSVSIYLIEPKTCEYIMGVSIVFVKEMCGKLQILYT